MGLFKKKGEPEKAASPAAPRDIMSVFGLSFFEAHVPEFGGLKLVQALCMYRVSTGKFELVLMNNSGRYISCEVGIYAAYTAALLVQALARHKAVIDPKVLMHCAEAARTQSESSWVVSQLGVEHFKQIINERIPASVAAILTEFGGPTQPKASARKRGKSKQS